MGSSVPLLCVIQIYAELFFLIGVLFPTRVLPIVKDVRQHSS